MTGDDEKAIGLVAVSLAANDLVVMANDAGVDAVVVLRDRRVRVAAIMTGLDAAEALALLVKAGARVLQQAKHGPGTEAEAGVKS